MKVSVEKLPTSEAVLEVDLTWDELEKASNKAYSKLVKQVDIPGFRRGKAPRSLLERRIGKESIYQEGLDDLISEAYRTAVKEHELTPIKQPELEAPVFEIGQPYHFSLKVPILTPVELGDYSSLHFEREEATVTSEEVEKELDALRERQSTWTEVEREAQYNDRVTMDLKLTVEDKTISDLKDNPFELTQERHGLFVGLDENVVGMKAGDSKEFTVTLPADYSNEKLAGKEAQYVLHLYKVELKEIPELDDTFAEKVSEGQFETLEDVRKALSDSILENKKRKIRDELREKVVNAVIEQAEVTIHPALIDEEAEAMMHQMEHLLQQQRMSMDQYLMLMRKSREEYLNDIHPDAENRVKRQLVLDTVAQKEEISVQPEELEALFRAYAQAGQALEQSEEQIHSMFITYRREKTVTRLVELTTDPDPDEELEEEISMENAEAAALAGDPDTADVTETIATIDTDTGETTDTSDTTVTTVTTDTAQGTGEAQTAEEAQSVVSKEPGESGESDTIKM